MKLFLTILVVLYCTNYLEGVRFRCDYKYTSIGWFKFHNIPSTFRDARLQCQLEGAILASPTTNDIKNVLKEYACGREILTGISATFAKGQFSSLEGKPLREINQEWVYGEPDNKNNAESCISMDSYGKFSDVSCDEPRQYVCYRKNSNVDVNVCGTPDPEYRIDSRTNKCYKFHTKARTFERAYFACSAEGGHLAIINSDQEATVIKEIFAKYPGSSMVGNFWKDVAFVGFHNYNEGTDWRTVHDETLVEAGYAKFSGGEPNNSTTGENCGSVYRNGLYNDLWCENYYAFICEKKPDVPPVCDSENEAHHLHMHQCNDQQIDARSDSKLEVY